MFKYFAYMACAMSQTRKRTAAVAPYGGVAVRACGIGVKYYVKWNVLIGRTALVVVQYHW